MNHTDNLTTETKMQTETTLNIRDHASEDLTPIAPAQYSDTDRLNHLITTDRSRIGLMVGDTASDGVIEEINFIFENPTCDNGPDVVRAAIDKSIQAHKLHEGSTH